MSMLEFSTIVDQFDKIFVLFQSNKYGYLCIYFLVREI